MSVEQKILNAFIEAIKNNNSEILDLTDSVTHEKLKLSEDEFLKGLYELQKSKKIDGVKFYYENDKIISALWDDITITTEDFRFI